MCKGALVRKTTYASLWAVIGNTSLNGWSADVNNFYLPDLRETSGPNTSANDNQRTGNTGYATFHPDGTVMAGGK